jgi:ribosomal protein S28E/S33
MAEVVRVLVPLDSQTSEALGTALGYAKAICKKTGARDIILLTHTKHQLDHTSLAGALGDRAIKALAKGPVAVEDGIQLHAETMRTLRWPPRSSVMIVYYAETEILDLADGTRNVVGVVAVPDIPGEANDWAARWGVMVHGAERKPRAVLMMIQ